MNLFQVNVVVAVTNGRDCTQGGLGVIGMSHKVIGVFIVARTWRTVGTGRFDRGGTQISSVDGRETLPGFGGHDCRDEAGRGEGTAIEGG